MGAPASLPLPAPSFASAAVPWLSKGREEAGRRGGGATSDYMDSRESVSSAGKEGTLLSCVYFLWRRFFIFFEGRWINLWQASVREGWGGGR